MFILRWFIAEQHVHQRESSRSSFSGALNLARSCAHRLFKRCYGLKHLEEKNTTVFFLCSILAGLQHQKERRKSACQTWGLFRCQEVCVMVMGQMREEGQSRPPGFEDSPPPPGPVHLQRADPPQKPRNNQIKEGLPLCAHAYVFISYIPPPHSPHQSFWVPQANQTVVISATKTPQISGALNAAVQITARLSSDARAAF